MHLLSKSAAKAIASAIMLTVCPVFAHGSPPEENVISGMAGKAEDAEYITLLFAGDMMQHMEQIRTAERLGRDTSSVRQHSFDYTECFSFMKGIIQDADIAVCNLEAPVGAPPYRGYPSFSAPAEFAVECMDAGFDIFLTANNHIGDRGRTGTMRTLETLDSLGVLSTGCEESEAKYFRNPLVVEKDGIRIAFINFTYGTNGIDIHRDYSVMQMEKPDVLDAILEAKMLMSDIIIALPHWGTEYSLEPDASQKSFGRFLLENGVHIIVGTHPHTPQPVEYTMSESGKVSTVTAYSLGNFISNMSAPYTRTGMMVRIRIRKDRYSWNPEIMEPETIPVWCSRPGGLTGNYTVIPVTEYLDRPELFRDRNDWYRMKVQYEHLKNRKIYDAREKTENRRH